MTAAANPSSSARTVTFTVTPDFAENAILISAATRPPITDLPYNFNVWVVVESVTSVPSRGCNDSVDASCSVASTFHVNRVINSQEMEGISYLIDF